MKMTAVSVLVNSAQISLPVWRYQPFVSQLKTSWAIFLFEFADLTTEKVSIFSYHRPIYDSPCATSKYCIVKTKKEKKEKRKKENWQNFVWIFKKDFLPGMDNSFSGIFAVFTDQYTMLYSPARGYLKTQHLFRREGCFHSLRKQPSFFAPGPSGFFSRNSSENSVL